MKKLSKFIYFIFAFAVIACMAIFNPAINFASAETIIDTAKVFSISTSKIASTVDAANDEKLIIPMPDVKGVDGNATKHIVVKDRSGKTYTYNCADKTTTDENGEVVSVNYFTLLKDTETVAGDSDEVKYIKVNNLGKGSYSVQYKVVDVTNSKTYYSEAKTVQVKSVAYSWKFDTESEKKIIPSVTTVSKEGVNTEFELPLPEIVKSNDSENPIKFDATDLGTAIKVTRGGKDVSTGTGAVVRVEGSKLIFTPALDTTVVPEGEDTTYVIKYIASAKGVTAFTNREFTVKVEKDYNTKAELEVSHNAITNYQVGATTTFPTANVTDKTHNKTNVEVNTYISIKDKNDNVVTLDANDYTHVFTESGDYTITYKVVDAYGNEDTSKPTSIRVSDKKPYQVSYAADYDTSATNWEDSVNTDIAYSIPSEVGFNGFWLPAIYAKDYKDGYDNLTFTRKIVSTSDSSIWFNLDSDDAVHGNGAYADNHTFYGVASDAKLFNKKVEFRFPISAQGTDESDEDYAKRVLENNKKYAGMTFKIEYTAEDSNIHNSEAYATSYTFKVAGEDALTSNVDKNLKIDFDLINKAIDPTEDFTFTTAVAKEEPTNAELVADERVEVRTYYYYGAKSKIEGDVETHISLADAKKTNEKYGYDFSDFYSKLTGYAGLTEIKSNDGVTSLKLDETVYDGSQSKVTIFAVAINDQNQFVIDAQEVAINKTGKYDTDGAPTISEVKFYDKQDKDGQVIYVGKDYSGQLASLGSTKFNQNYVVELPGIKFSDMDSSLEVSVNCYVDTPDQTVGVDIEEFFAGSGIKLASVTTTYAGTYYVVYTATDDAGNKTSYISTFDVAETEKGYIKVENGSNITKNVGEEVVFNVSLAGNGKYDYTEDNFTITWGENKPSGLGSMPNSFKFDKPGTYVATIGIDKYVMNGVTYTDTPSVTVTIKVTAPTMSWASDIDSVLANRTADVDDIIELPIISATENGVEINAEAKVVYLDKNDKETEVELKLDETTFTNYYFKAEKNGVYKVTYTATTAYNSLTKSFTVTCGDYYDPTITITSNKLEDSKITYNGQKIDVSVKFDEKKNEQDNDIVGQYILTVIGKEGDKQVFNYDISVDLQDTNDKGEINYFTPDSSTFTLTGDSVSNNGNNKWIIDGVGDYKLTLTVKDDNGNTTTKSISFKVENKTEPKTIKDSVVGIVLIVVSVVLLGGVILFFAFAGKRNKSKRKSVKVNKD